MGVGVDVEGLHLNSQGGRRNSHSHSHSPLADPGYNSNSPNGTSPNGKRCESDSGDDSNDMPWDHSLVIAEPDIEVHISIMACYVMS